MEPRLLRASPKQFSTLIDFMERNGDLSKPVMGSQGRLRSDHLWLELTSLLNSIGGGVKKSTEKWKRVWADWKTKTKKKGMIMKRVAAATSGGPYIKKFTPLEERVMAVMGYKVVDGKIGTRECGFNDSSQVQATGDRPERNPHSDSTPSTSRPLLSPVPVFPETEKITLQLGTMSPILSPPPGFDTSPLVPESLPQTPSAAASHRQLTNSPRVRLVTPRRLMRVQRSWRPTPFHQTSAEFVAVENRWLELEELRVRQLHDREIERLRLEEQRNQILQQLCDAVQRYLDSKTL